MIPKSIGKIFVFQDFGQCQPFCTVYTGLLPACTMLEQRYYPTTLALQKGSKKCTQEMRSELKLLSLYSRRRFFRFIIIFQILNYLNCPKQLLGIFKLRSILRNRELRDKTMLHLPKVNSKMGQTMFEYAGAKDWNSLPINIRQITSINIFKQTLLHIF